MIWQPGLLSCSSASLCKPVALSSQQWDPGDSWWRGGTAVRNQAAAPGGTGLPRTGGPSRGSPVTRLPSGSRAVASRRVALRLHVGRRARGNYREGPVGV